MVSPSRLTVAELKKKAVHRPHTKPISEYKKAGLVALVRRTTPKRKHSPKRKRSPKRKVHRGMVCRQYSPARRGSPKRAVKCAHYKRRSPRKIKK